MADKTRRKSAVSVEDLAEFFGKGFTRNCEERYAKGYAEGFLEGRRELVFLRLTKWFGLSDNAARRRLRKSSEAELTALAVATRDFQSKADLYRWLRENYD